MIDISTSEGVLTTIEERWLVQLEHQMGRMVHAAGLSETSERELEASLRLCDDNEIRALNRDYRHKDRPTDVLAFAQREGEGADLCPELLGDIVISLETAARQAKSGLYAEVVHLAAHGLCHLLGYDHQDDAEELAMNARMAALIGQSEADGPVEAA